MTIGFVTDGWLGVGLTVRVVCRWQNADCRLATRKCWRQQSASWARHATPQRCHWQRRYYTVASWKSWSKFVNTHTTPDSGLTYT